MLIVICHCDTTYNIPASGTINGRGDGKFGTLGISRGPKDKVLWFEFHWRSEKVKLKKIFAGSYYTFAVVSPDTNSNK